MPNLPLGTVTFVFTDVEGSTRLWEDSPDQARLAMARHDELIEAAVVANDGILVRPRGEGDSRFAVFSRATDAVAAAIEIQKALGAEPWPTPTPIRVRMAIHAGEADLRDGDYYGTAVNRCARIRSAGHGGQVLLSTATQELVRDDLPVGASVQDLGEHRLRDLIRPERVFQLLHPDLPADFPPLRTLDLYPNNLPLQLTSFVGREREIAEVKRLLKASRLVTLTGIGGCGKTRLCLQVSADLLDDYPDGVFLAELAPVADPELVPRSVAAALDLREETNRPILATLLDHLRARKVLLILDNCEHLIEACARLADSLLHACPLLQLLATSREALGIPGELPYRVPSLSLPDSHHLPTPDQLSQFESVRLFLDRARSVNSSFHVSTANAPAIAQITWRLDGIPLAIELAAAKTRLLTPEQIAHRLDDQFRLLAGGSRTAVPRQQTLRAAIDWSFSLLSPDEQTLFRRLAVFSGGFSLDAAEVVCSQEPLDPFQLLDLLSSLVDKSLVLVDQPDGQQNGQAQAGSEARYHLLETIRQYARDRLLEAGEAQATRERHLSFYLQLAETAREGDGSAGDASLARQEREIGNLRAALEWSVDTAPELGLRLAAGLWDLWGLRGYHTEGRRWAEALLPLAPERNRTRALALLAAANLAIAQGGFAVAEAHLEESVGIYREVGHADGQAFALAELGNLASSRGDYARANALLAEALEFAKTRESREALVWTLDRLGVAAHLIGDLERARMMLEEALGLALRIGEGWLIAWMPGDFGNLLASMGDMPRARALLEESVARARELGDAMGMSWRLLHLGYLLELTGEGARAREMLEESLALHQGIDQKHGVCLALAALANLDRREGRYDAARQRLFESLRIDSGQRDPRTASHRLWLLGILAGAVGDHVRAATLISFGVAQGRYGTLLYPADEADAAAALQAAQESLGESACAAACQAGAAMSLAQAIGYVMA